jgi:hypothetical protein
LVGWKNKSPIYGAKFIGILTCLSGLNKRNHN